MTRRLALWVGLGAAMAAVTVAAALVLPASERADSPREGTGAPTDTAGSHAPAAGSAAEAARLVGAAQADAAAGRWQQAHAQYERAFALVPEPSTLFELAVIEHRMGRCREARRTARRVLAAPDRALVGRAQQLLAAIGRCD